MKTAPTYHGGRYVADPNLPRYLCPHCGLLLNLDAYIELTGRDPRPIQGPRLPRRTLLPGVPETPDDFRDPSDDPTYLIDRRAVR